MTECSSTPLVTIAIPTYNRAATTLPQALGCAINQTYPNIEIIVSDNCSTDHTGEVVKNFGDCRVRYLRHERNIGANNNFNFCVQQARGAYILMLFDDDLIDPDMVEVCMTAAKGNAEFGIVRTGTRVIDAEGKVIVNRPNQANGLPFIDFFIAWLNKETAFYLCSTLFNTKRLKEIGGFQSPHNLYQDVVAELMLAAKFSRLDICDIKASFRIHDTNLGSAAKISSWSDDALYLLDIMSNLAPEHEALINQCGMRAFCIKDYLRTAHLGSPIKHLGTYLMIYKKYGYCSSPLPVIFRQFLRPHLRAAKQKLLRAVTGN